jgi:ABC-type nickel/cobalt efflux system permease component RcnA
MLMRDLTPMMGTPQDHAIAMISYLQGKASAVLEHVHQVCGACGKDHVAEDLAALEKDLEEPEPEEEQE